MWNNREFWRRVVATLLTATEEGRLEWEDTPEEPTFRAIFADGMIELMRPAGEGLLPEVGVFEPGYRRIGVFRPEQPEDVALVEQMYRSAQQHYHPYEDGYPSKAREGELMRIQPVLRSIEAELNKTKGSKGTIRETGLR